MGWIVEKSQMHWGQSKKFWFKKSALKHAEQEKDSWPWITIKNTITKEMIDFKVPKKYPIEIYDERGLPTGETFGDWEY